MGPDTRRPARIVAVCGAGNCDQVVWELAKRTGAELAKNKMTLLCGGLGGVMTAAAQGAREAGGLTVGLLPGSDPKEANPFIDLPLATGLGPVRNALIVRAAQAIIALPGEAGTLSEVALGLKMGKPVIGLKAWAEIDGVKVASTAEEAVAMVCALLGDQRLRLQVMATKRGEYPNDPYQKEQRYPGNPGPDSGSVQDRLTITDLGQLQGLFPFY